MVRCNITKFNAHVQLLLKGLESRGETTHDLMSNMFKGYAAASDNNFTKYIEHKREEYKDNTYIKPTSLMSLADNKYKNLKIKGVWNAISQEEEKILALKNRKSEKATVQKEADT